MLTLNRPAFCALVGIEPVTLGNMIRRGQVPFEVDQKTSGRGYSFFEAYLMLIARSFAQIHRIDLVRSADIASDVSVALPPVWPEIVRSGQLLAEGTDRPVVEVMAGRAERAGLPPVAVAGTDRAIDASLRKLDGVVIGSVRISASRQAAEMIQRAYRHEVRIPAEFWSGPLSHRPRRRLTPAEISASVGAGAR